MNIENTKNKELMADHRTICQHLKDYKDKKRLDPPLNKTGKEIKQAKVPTMMKTQIQCHYHQQHRLVSFTKEQSTCYILCVNQATTQQYFSGECPLCICPCSKSYYMEDVPKIKAELLLEIKCGTKVSSSKDEAMR